MLAAGLPGRKLAGKDGCGAVEPGSDRPEDCATTVEDGAGVGEPDGGAGAALGIPEVGDRVQVVAPDDGRDDTMSVWVDTVGIVVVMRLLEARLVCVRYCVMTVSVVKTAGGGAAVTAT